MENKRFLKRIIFINSAHIAYASVELNGHIHLMGTQGVGKSTLLRAVLFFYNADKERLGIRRNGQQTFDQFYLPYTNSYIAYEVNRPDNRVFTVLMFRRNNTAAFRFIDAPFDDRWVLDDNRLATSDPNEVKRRVGAISVSPIVKFYKDYLDIIYGNYHAVKSAELRRYYILESAHYRNIPRVIQNVFLNERVDADFIKDTIISSMGDESVESLPVKVYRDKLATFTKEYRDIQRWFEINKQGINDTERKAQAVTDTWRNIFVQREQVVKLCGMLNYSIHEAERTIPILHKHIGDVKLMISNLDEKLKSLKSEYETKHDEIIARIGVARMKINECRKEKKKYDDMGIDAMLELDGKKDSLDAQKKNLDEIISGLESQFSNVVQKYDNLLDSIENDKLTFRNNQVAALEKKARENMEKKESLQDAKTDRKEAIDEDFKEKLKAADELIADKTNVVHSIELKEEQTRHSKPLDDEVQKAQKNLDDAMNEQAELNKRVMELNALEEKLQNAFQIDTLKKEQEFAPSISAHDKEIDRLQERIEEQTNLLNQLAGSLCEWLDNNGVEGWQDNIGKVISDAVLYHADLSPQMVTNGGEGSLYGIDIDLTEIENEVRTPGKIQAEIDGYSSLLAEEKNARKAKLEQKQKEIDAIEQKYNKKLKEVRNELSMLKQKLLLLPQTIEKANLTLTEALQNQDAERDRLLTELAEAKGIANVQLEEAQNEKMGLDEARKKQRLRVDAEFDAEVKALKKEYDALAEKQKKELEEYCAMRDAEKANVQEQRNKALKDEGVDIDLLNGYKEQRSSVEATLDTIEKNKETITIYKNKFAEVISKEPEYVKEKAKLETKRDNIEGNYKAACEKKNAALKSKQQELEDAETLVKAREDGLAKAKEFVESSSCPEAFHTAIDIKNGEECGDIHSKLMLVQLDISNKLKELHTHVFAFKDLFSDNNTFKFPTELDYDEDFLRYAESVNDFVSNNKIKEYKKLTNTIYADIIKTVGERFNDLKGKESAIMKIVNEINYDFEHKAFAGVIKKIELRLTANENSLITNLQNVTDFYLENADSLGEMNLFTSIEDNLRANKEAVNYLKRLSEILSEKSDVNELFLTDLFTLQIRVKENDNDSGFTNNFRMVGSDGTDVLVKAIINIMLINVFKQRATRHSKEFLIHCMMDEIGRLSNENIAGLLQFAADRDICIVNSSPQAHKPNLYRHLYVLSKDEESHTQVQEILSSRTMALQQND